ASADPVECRRSRRDDLVDRPTCRDGIKAWHIAKDDRLGINPDAGHLALAPHGHLALGAAHHRDDVAASLGSAKENHRSAGKPGGDRDEMAAEFVDDAIGACRPAGACQRSKEQKRQARPSTHVCSVLITHRLGGRIVKSWASLAATASTISASRKRSCSPRRRVPNRVPNWAPSTPPRSRTRVRTASTVRLVYACRKVTLAATKMICSSDVPGTTWV